MSDQTGKNQPVPYTLDITDPGGAFVARVTRDLGELCARLIVHIMVSARRHPDAPGGWVPVPASFIRKYFRYVDIDELVRLGFLEADRRYAPGKCRRYRLAPAFAEQVAVAAARGVASSAVPVDAETGRWLPVRQLPVRRTPRRDGNEKLWPALVLAGLLAFARCVYDRDAVETAIARAAERASNIGDPEERALAFVRVGGDARSYAAVLRQRPREVGPALWEYPSAYAVQKTGRVGERGGGLQSMSAALRAAAFASMGARYYDIVASHPSITACWMGDLGLEAAWLRRWAGDRPWRDALSGEVGLDAGVLKSGVLALLSGAAFPTLVQTANPKVPSKLVKDLRKAATLELPGGVRVLDVEALADIHDLARRALVPLADELAPWFGHVRRHYLTPGAPGIEVHGRREFVRNAAGMRYYPWDEDRDGQNRLPTLLAHLLQGAEAAVVHRLAAMGPEHGYEAVLNLHDGFVSLGTVPDEAVSAALKATGLHGVRLGEKPFELAGSGSPDAPDGP